MSLQNIPSHSRILSFFRVAMVDGQGDLEDQLAEVKKKSAEIADRKEDLRIIEDLGAQMEEALILDNKWVPLRVF